MAPSCGLCGTSRSSSGLGSTLAQAARLTPTQAEVSCGTITVVEPEDPEPEPEERDLLIPLIAAGGIGAAILAARNQD